LPSVPTAAKRLLSVSNLSLPKQLALLPLNANRIVHCKGRQKRKEQANTHKKV